MRKIIILLIFFTSTSFLLAKETRPLKIVATATIMADMTKNIVGDQSVVHCIVPAGADPHVYDPTPADAKLIADADLIIQNGLTFEGWLSELISNSGTKAKVITLTEGVDVIGSLDYTNSNDPHAWMNAANALVYIKNIKDALVEINPKNEEVYNFNYGVYKQQIEQLDNYILKEIQKIPENRRILITSHDAFQYYGKKYGIRLEAIQGTSTEAEAQTSDIIRLTKTIKENNIPAVFIESTINPKLLKGLAKENDIVVGGELFADSLGDEESEAATYLDMLRYNTDVIVAALSREVAVPVSTSSEEAPSSPYLTWGLLGLLLIGGFFFVFRQINN